MHKPVQRKLRLFSQTTRHHTETEPQLNEHYEKWDEFAPRGLLLIGFGISVIGQAIGAKTKGKSFLRWFFTGTIGLILINSGVAIFGEAIKHRTLYDFKLQQYSSED